jgi:hypothetical protein
MFTALLLIGAFMFVLSVGGIISDYIFPFVIRLMIKHHKKHYR